MRKNSDARTAREARRMINLSIRGANAERIFPHANVTIATHGARDDQKCANNPMHSSQGVVFEVNFVFSETDLIRRATQWQNVIVRQEGQAGPRQLVVPPHGQIEQPTERPAADPHLLVVGQFEPFGAGEHGRQRDVGDHGAGGEGAGAKMRSGAESDAL